VTVKFPELHDATSDATSAAPRLVPALGAPRLTATAQVTGHPAEWSEHARVHGEPLTALRSGQIINQLERTGVLGRGGAGFPLLIKMKAAAGASGRPVIVVNASEGEPAIWKDRTLLSRVPHLVLDGAQLAAAALGADRIHVAVNPTYRPAHLALMVALSQRRERFVDVVPVSVHIVPDEFTAGECSSVVGLINGGRGRPEFTKTIAAVRGVNGRPTLLSNTETFAQLAILSRMGDRYADVGAPGEPGTAMFTVRGAVREDVVVEAPLGTTVGDLVAGVGGLVEPIQAVLVGGYHGRWMPVHTAWNAPLSVAEMRARGGAVGAGLVVPLAANACPLVEVSRVVEYLAAETAGQCGPCVNGLPAIADAVTSLARGLADDSTLNRIARWSGLVTGRGLCKHPDGTVGFVRSALDVFGDHVERHLHGPCGLPRRNLLPVGALDTAPRSRWARR
jgi:NADH:ubiquinone oxidoreductase subunit F (NADH-binding)